MSKFNSVRIRDVVDELNVSYFVPDIQRSYVWLQNPREKKIEQLFDSLMRGYPIGSFLFWRLKKDDIETDNSDSDSSSGKLNFQLYKFIENFNAEDAHNEKILTTQIKDECLHIVLDGQQRLTSLYIGLRGSRRLRKPYVRWDNPNKYDTRFLYLDLHHRPVDDDPDDGYHFEFKTPEQVKSDNSDALWFRVSTILNFNNDQDDIWNYCADKGFSRSEENMITTLYRAIAVDENLSFFEETEKSLDKVLKIFIRVNSGGMQLSYSDLLMSLLTATFKTEIRDRMEQFVDELSDAGFACIGRDQILKTCLMLSDCNHIFKLNNFCKSNIRKIEQNWDGIVNSILQSVKILTSLGYKDCLSSGYIASIIAYYLFKRGITRLTDDDKKAIGMFVKIAQIRAFYTTGLDGKLSRSMELLDAARDFSDFLDKANEKFEVFKVTADDIDWFVNNIKYGSYAVFPLLQLLYPNLNYGIVSFHIDHIYPKSKFVSTTVGLPDNYIGRQDEIFNLQLLEGTANEEKRAKNPKDWVEVQYPQKDTREKYYSDNYIGTDCTLEWSDIPIFEKERKRLISQKLKKAFGVNDNPETKKETEI